MSEKAPQAKHKEELKQAIRDFSTHLTAELPKVLEALRYHGVHSTFCGDLADIREEWLKNN